MRILSLLLALVFACPAYADQTVRFVGDPWPPYVNGVLGEDASSGIVVEIVTRIFNRIENASASFPLIPWNRALREVEDGHSDGIAALLKTEEREAYLLYSDPLLTGANLVWSAKNADGKTFEWSGIEDLQGLRLGVTEGYSNGESIDQAIESGVLNVVPAPTVEQLFAMLANGRVDIALANDAVGYALALNYPDAAILPATRPTDLEVFYIGISRKSAAVRLMPEINAAIELLRAEGTIDQIVRGN